ncbi:hypothetical protein [uncultured Phycicoccus sp.]|uniref:hypothetical protein n=1 Tax=uncultured Phycicoccus sp. TaxID=661422 RepID=UPI002610FC1F|nr:hypothetical protein [uncultured Phycicoccus sp.]
MSLGPSAPPSSRSLPRTAFAALLGALFLLYQGVVAIAVDNLDVPNPRTGWDAVHYVGIAERGYPSGGSPGDPPAGYQDYAFHPLYPLLMRAAGFVLDLPPADVGPWLNLSLATAAIVVLARWVIGILGTTAAVTVVVAITVWPSSPVFQMAYTEGLALLLLVLTWQLASDERHGLATASIVALSFARPLAVPLAATITVVALLRWRSTREWTSVRGLLGVVVAAAVATVAWPVWAGFHSGDPLVYLEAHNSYATPGAPLSPALWALTEPLIGVLLVLILVVTTTIGLKLMPMGTPPLLKAWVVLYPPYLALGSLITPSLLRYFMFAFPAALYLLPVARRRGPALVALALAVGIGLLGAWWWVGLVMPPHPYGIYP